MATYLKYVGLVLCGFGVKLVVYPDPDAIVLAVPLLIGGTILFLENLKRDIADAVAARRGQAL